MAPHLVRRAWPVVFANLVTLALGCSSVPTSPVSTGALPDRTGTTSLVRAPVPTSATSSKSCKVAQVYASSTSDKGWSWAHEQAFLTAHKDFPWIDLSIRADGVPDDICLKPRDRSQTSACPEGECPM
jgi:hypothetical protein